MFSKLKLIDLLLHLFHLKYFSHAKSFPITTNTPVLTETSAKKSFPISFKILPLKHKMFCQMGVFYVWFNPFIKKYFAKAKYITFTLPPIPILFETSVKKAIFHKMARGHLVFALFILPSFRPSVPSKFVLSTPPTSLHGFEWHLAGMLHHKSRSACGEIIYVRQIFAELWSLTLRIFTHFNLSSKILLHPCMDLNETWQGCCITSLEVHVGR